MCVSTCSKDSLCTCVNFLERVPVCIHTRTGEVGPKARPTLPDFAPVAKATPVCYVSLRGLAKLRGRCRSVFSIGIHCAKIKSIRRS